MVTYKELKKFLERNQIDIDDFKIIILMPTINYDKGKTIVERFELTMERKQNELP